MTINDEKIFSLLCESTRPLSRSEIVVRTGIARTTVYDALQRMLLRNLITFKFCRSKPRGRPRTVYCILGPLDR